MSSHSDAPQPAGSEHEFKLPVEGFKGTPEEIERQWFEQVYKGRGDSMRQLTWRAVLMGSVLGGVLSLTNLYIGLKAGWGFGVAITACILSYAIWTGLHKIRVAKTPMTILENNCMQSTASAAGYSTGSTLVSAFAAYILINGQSLSIGLMLAWVFFLAILGVTMAVPMKRQMINVEQLRFPSGLAAAETLRALYSHGTRGMRAAKALFVSGGLAALDKFWAEGMHLADAAWLKWFNLKTHLAALSSGALVKKFNETVIGQTWMERTVHFTWDAVFVAAGAITGIRVCISMFIGSVLCWVFYVPLLQHQGVITSTAYKDLVQWTLWGGTACMVTSGLLVFALQWRTVLRAFAGLGKMFSRSAKGPADEMSAIETPGSWFIIGQLVSLVALAWLAHASFAIPVWQSALAVAMSFFLALVACRVTGETDITPIGAMGKVTQITFGALNPGKTNVNLMTANITSGAAISAADLLTDLKSGYLLGANPRKQFLAQFAGIFVGTVVTVLCFQVLVPSPDALGTDQFPAPAAQTWKGVAVAMSEGLAALGPIKAWSIGIGGLVGIILPLLAKAFPKREKFIPSPAALGLAWVFHWYYGLLFLIGGIIGWAWEKRAPRHAEEYLFAVMSGIIAGGSLMGVLLVFLENGPTLWKKFFGG